MPSNYNFEPFRDVLRREGKRPLTISGYGDVLRQFERWWHREEGETAAFDPKAVTVHDVRAYRGYLIKEKKEAAATINRKLSGLSAFFRIALAREWTSVDPTRGVQGVHQVRPGPRALDRKMINRLLRVAYSSDNKRDIAVLELLINTGIRVGELTKLTMDDITLKERKGSLRVRSGKGEVYRTVPLNSDARRALRDYLKVRPDAPTRDLFLSQERRGMSVGTAWRIVKKCGAGAGVELSPHVLRHTFGTRMVRVHKTDLVLVARLMGHQDVNTTARYAEPSEDDLAEAVEVLAAE